VCMQEIIMKVCVTDLALALVGGESLYVVGPQDSLVLPITKYYIMYKT